MKRRLPWEAIDYTHEPLGKIGISAPELETFILRPGSNVDEDEIRYLVTDRNELLAELATAESDMQEMRDVHQDEKGDLELALENAHEEVSGLMAEIENLEERGPVVKEIVEMPSLARDSFLADLCRECALLGIEWPADPRAETTVITKDRDHA